MGGLPPCDWSVADPMPTAVGSVRAVLIDALLSGNYRDTACRLAGVAESGVRAWVKAADDGDPRYRTIATLIQAAEAIAESDSVRHVRSAGKDPRFWAAAATWLERKFPQKYGRRQEDTDVPRVIVQIGIHASDVVLTQVTTSAAQALPIGANRGVDET